MVVHKYYINRVSLSQDCMYLKSAAMLFLKLNINRYDLGLSNEILFFIMAQGAAKLSPVKVGDQEKIRDSNPGHT